VNSADGDRDRRTFRWGVVAVVVLGLAVFTPLAALSGTAATYFFVEMVLVAALVGWYETRKRQHR
jgi:hypothetical protein